MKKCVVFLGNIKNFKSSKFILHSAIERCGNNKRNSVSDENPRKSSPVSKKVAIKTKSVPAADIRFQILNQSDKKTCHICTKTVNSMFELYTHLKEVHLSTNRKPKEASNTSMTNSTSAVDQDAFYCPICARPFTRQVALKVHMSDHKKEDERTKLKYRCDICWMSFPEFSELRKHKAIHYNSKDTSKHVSVATNIRPANIVSDRLHSSDTIYKITKYRCQICSQIFNELLELQEHLKVKHDFKWPKTPISLKCSTSAVTAVLDQNQKVECSRTTHVQSRETTVLHRLDEQQEPVKNIEDIKYLCYICILNFATIAELKNHQKQLHKDLGRINCGICFQQITSFESHLCPVDIHECGICGISFVNDDYLRKHLFKHMMKKSLKTYGKTYTCLTCNIKFNSRERWSHHIALFHKEEQVLNVNRSLTQKAFTKVNSTSLILNNSYLNSLLEATPNTRSFEKIGTTSTLPSTECIQEVQEHPSRGQGYYCEKCNKQFYDETSLSVHMVLHNTETGTVVSKDVSNLPNTNCINACGSNDQLVTEIMVLPDEGGFEDIKSGGKKDCKVMNEGSGNFQMTTLTEEHSYASAPPKQNEGDSNKNGKNDCKIISTPTEEHSYASSTIQSSSTISSISTSEFPKSQESIGREESGACRTINVEASKPKIFLKNLSELMEPTVNDNQHLDNLNCHYCKKQFVHKRTLLYHMKQACLQKCTLCNFFACNAGILDTHYDKDHPGQLYHCSYCDFVNVSRQGYINHLVETHEKKSPLDQGITSSFNVPVDCGMCNLTFSNVIVLKTHLSATHNIYNVIK